MSNDMLESKDNNLELELELELAINSEKSSTASHRRHESNACVTKGNKTSIRILISLLSIALATLFYNHWSTPDLSSLDRVAYKTVLAELSRWNIHKVSQTDVKEINSYSFESREELSHLSGKIFMKYPVYSNSRWSIGQNRQETNSLDDKVCLHRSIRALLSLQRATALNSNQAIQVE